MKLPLKPLLFALGGATTAYALVLLFSGDAPLRSLLHALLTPSGAGAAALCLANYLLRGWRWRLWMAHYGRPLAWLTGWRLYLAGYTFTPTPGNVGEAARGLLLREPLSTADSLALYGAERMADLLGLLVLTLPGWWWLLQQPQTAGWPWALLGVLVLAGALALGLGLVFRAALLSRWRWLQAQWRRAAWLQGAWHCLAQRPWRWLGLTVLAWAAQGMAVWLVCQQFGLSISALLASGIYALAMVGGALSMLPAGLGGTEALLSGLLAWAGAPLGTALQVTVLVRLLTLWLAVGIGLLALLYSAAVRRDISLR